MFECHSNLTEKSFEAIFNEIEKLIGKQTWEEIDAKTVNPMILKHFKKLPVKTFKSSDFFLSINNLEQSCGVYSYLISLQTNISRSYDYIFNNSLYDLLFNPESNEFFFYEKGSSYSCSTGNLVWFKTKIRSHSKNQNIPPHSLENKKYMFTLVDYSTQNVIKTFFAFFSPIDISIHNCVALEFDDETSNIITATGDTLFAKNLRFAENRTFGDGLIFIINDDGNFQIANLYKGIIYPEIYTMYNINTKNKACAQLTDGSWVYIEKNCKITPIKNTQSSCLYAKFKVSLYNSRYNDTEYFLPVNKGEISSIKEIPDANLQYVQFLLLPSFVNIKPPTGPIQTNVKVENDLENAFGFSKVYVFNPHYSTNKPFEYVNFDNFMIVPYEEFRTQPNLFRLMDFGF